MKKNKAIDLAVKYLEHLPRKTSALKKGSSGQAREIRWRSLAAVPLLQRVIQAGAARSPASSAGIHGFEFGIRAQKRMDELTVPAKNSRDFKAIALLQSLKDVRAQRSDQEDPA